MKSSGEMGFGALGLPTCFTVDKFMPVVGHKKCGLDDDYDKEGDDDDDDDNDDDDHHHHADCAVDDDIDDDNDNDYDNLN